MEVIKVEVSDEVQYKEKREWGPLADSLTIGNRLPQCLRESFSDLLWWRSGGRMDGIGVVTG